MFDMRTTRGAFTTLFTLVMLSVPAPRAMAQGSSTALDRAQRASESPLAASVRIGWLEGFRARVGVDIPVYLGPASGGWAVHLAPMIELYDRELGNVFPSQYWRGALSLSVGYRAEVERTEALSLIVGGALVLAHESDHESVSAIIGGVPTGRFNTFLFTNTAGARGSLALVASEFSVAADLTFDVHVLSCTYVSDECESRTGDQQQSLGLSLDVVLRTGAPDDLANVQLCAAVHAGWIAGVDRVLGEARLLAHAGPCIRWADVGEWSLLAQLALGSQTGMHRHVDEITAGGALRWTL